MLHGRPSAEKLKQLWKVVRMQFWLQIVTALNVTSNGCKLCRGRVAPAISQHQPATKQIYFKSTDWDIYILTIEKSWSKMSNSLKNTRYGTLRHGGPAVCHVIHVIHVCSVPVSVGVWLWGWGEECELCPIITDNSSCWPPPWPGRGTDPVATPSCHHRHLWILDTGEWLHNTGFSKYQFIHVHPSSVIVLFGHWKLVCMCCGYLFWNQMSVCLQWEWGLHHLLSVGHCHTIALHTRGVWGCGGLTA